VTETKIGSAEAVARAYFDALAARDARKMASHWDPQGVEDIVPFGIFRGPDEVQGFFDELFTAIPDAEATVENVVADEERGVVAVQWRQRGTFSGGPIQGIGAVGKHVELRGLDLLEIKDGKIVRNTAYADGLSFARQVGLVPPQGSGAEKAMFGAFNGLTKLKATLGEKLGGSTK
jgi:steroid delta-isomerase-like uncharacterized protein